MSKDLMYCPTCKRNVATEKDWSIGIFIILLILGILFGILYYVLKDKVRCSICHTSEAYLQYPHQDNCGCGHPHQHVNHTPPPATGAKANFCSNCGTPMLPEAAFCTKCGKQN